MEEARRRSPVTIAYRQLGWTATTTYEREASYILGNTLYHPDGSAVPARLVEQAANIGKAMHAHGTLPEWQRAFNLLGLPGYEAYM